MTEGRKNRKRGERGRARRAHWSFGPGRDKRAVCNPLPPELGGEVLAGGKAAVERDFQHAAFRLRPQLLGGQFKTLPVQMLDGCRVGDLLGVMDEMRHTQPASPCHRIHGPSFGKLGGMLA